MAARARGTYAHLRRLAAELEEFKCRILVKLGYPVDGAAEDEREHMWFEAHALLEDAVDATLLSAPSGIAGMQPGQRSRHPLERLTSWVLTTPAGPVLPHDTTPVRELRARPDEWRRRAAAASE